MNKTEKEDFKMKLEQDGLATVTENIAQKTYGNAQGKTAFAQTWVNAKLQEQNTSHKEKALNLQKESNKIAWRALCISIIALLVSISVAIFK